MKKFENIYAKILDAEAKVFMSIGEKGELTFVFKSKESITTFIVDGIMGRAKDEIKKNITKHTQNLDVILTKKQAARFLKFNIILSNIKILYTIYKDIQNQELVEEQYSSQRKEARKRKILFCIQILAMAEVGSTSSPAYIDRIIYLHEQFYEFEKRLQAWLTWDQMEKKISGERLGKPYDSGPQWNIHPKHR